MDLCLRIRLRKKELLQSSTSSDRVDTLTMMPSQVLFILSQKLPTSDYPNSSSKSRESHIILEPSHLWLIVGPDATMKQRDLLKS